MVIHSLQSLGWNRVEHYMKYIVYIVNRNVMIYLGVLYVTK